MQVYQVPEFETQPAVGQIVNMAHNGNIKAFRLVSGPHWHFCEIDQVNVASYDAKLLPFASHGSFPRMEDGGCALCSGIGCEQCNYSGGY